jgi:hypothetical protein
VKRTVLALVALLAFAGLAPTAQAHGGSRISPHRIQKLDGQVRAFGVYQTARPHHRLVVTLFIVRGDHVVGEKTRHCSKTSRCRVQLAVDCTKTTPVYAVIQANTKKGGHFANWNSRKVVCKR